MGNRLRTILRSSFNLFPVHTHLNYIDASTLRRIPNLPSFHQCRFFCTQQTLASSALQLILKSDWSPEVEKSLENLNAEWTHDSLAYTMKRLDKDGQKQWEFFNWILKRGEFKPNSLIYSILLRTLVRMKSKKFFWLAIYKMKEDSIHLDEETYTTLLITSRDGKTKSSLRKFYTTHIKNEEEDHLVQRISADWILHLEVKETLSENIRIRALRKLSNDPEKALSFFRFICNQETETGTTIAYNEVLRILLRGDETQRFWEVAEEIKRRRLLIDMDTYGKLSREFVKRKKMEDAVRLYEYMMEGPYKPSSQNTHLLIGSIALITPPDMSLVYRVVRKFEENGNSAGKPIYDAVHRALTSGGMMEEAGELMETMVSKGMTPDNTTYSQMVFGFCKSDRTEEAWSVIELMKSRNCHPDIKTWTVLIKATDTFERIVEPDAELLHVLVKGLVSKERVKEAHALVKESKTQPFGETFGILIPKLLEEKGFEEALDVLRMMKKGRVPADAAPFVGYVSRFGDAGMAVRFFEVLSSKEYPSVAAYKHMFQAFLRHKRFPEARDFLFKVPYHIRKHTEITYLFQQK